MTKIYVLDTNVLLQDPFALFAFEEHEVIIPAIVLEEIDSKKRNMDEIGRHARTVSRLIDQLREKGRLHQGVPLENGGSIRVELNHRSFESVKESFIDRTNDNRIIAVALNLQIEEQQKEIPKQVILVSKDVLVRVKADALGIETEDFLNDRVIKDDDIYNGYREFYVSDHLINQFYRDKKIPVSEITKEPTYPYEFFILKGLNMKSSAIGIIDASGKLLTSCYYGNETVWGIKGRNAQQVMALELLQRPDVHLVTLIGKAGTGKTLLALASGLLQTEDLHLYKKLLIARSIMPVGKDIGYLPGEKAEKLRPWLQPVYDNLEFLFNTKRKGEIEDILAGISSIETEAITYIRGRSIPEQFIIIDEAQNLTKHEVKTILTRVGEGTKIILMGDPEQVDHPYLDQYNNGLTYVVEKMKDQDVSGHVKLQKGERSKLAQIAADVL
ncbi:PhoH family protein [Pullulanibacillus sp. KACC 23026]|uniref:PhoH family protein n=1 Tax=Pullulanibacillus sp. KACC 23026 TaxID=3028315 RepID=UPI0023AE8467|nr:PhoH family protein [Pullulanibacillus sp. KACC 23026]WEG11712.1 PhoH family protein [Pullulanibacillus sp. KACC 23026]